MPILFSGGPVATMDGTRAEAVVVDGGRIAAVGGRDLGARYPEATVVDLAGRTLAPAFIDAHNHLSVSALHPMWGDASGVDGPDALADAIRRQAAIDTETGWVRLHDWNEAGNGYTPTRADLDAVGLDRPVVVTHYSLHQAVVSSAALDDLGIGRGTPDPDGGEILRAPDGEPNGLLLERAWSEAHARSLAAYADPDRWAEHVAAHGRALWRHGITAVHDAACSPDAEAVYAQLASSGDLPVSVVAMPHPAAILVNDHAARLDGPRTGDGDEQLRVGAMKLFADGGIAIALDTTVSGHAIRYGLLMHDLEDCATRAVDAGFRIAVHAIGNAGVEHTLAAFDAVRGRADADHRFRVEHAGVTSADQWTRLAALDAVAVVQPGFVEHVGESSGGVRFDDHHWLAFAGLADAGVTLAGSSDEPCAPVAPLWGAALGASRTTSTGLRFEPEQAVDIESWLHAYTAGAAFAGGQEDERGRLVPGLVADLVVLDRAPDGGLAVSETWRAGEQVYAADA